MSLTNLFERFANLFNNFIHPFEQFANFCSNNLFICWNGLPICSNNLFIHSNGYSMLCRPFINCSLSVHFSHSNGIPFCLSRSHNYLYAPADNIACLFQNTLSETKFQASLSLSYGSPPWLLGLIVWLVLRYSVACMQA